MKNDQDQKLPDTWNPEQYKKFDEERNQPFYDLIKLISPFENMRVVDLGCGTGQLTAILHQSLQAAHTLGIDSSPAMLKESTHYQKPGLEYKLMKYEKPIFRSIQADSHLGRALERFESLF